MSFYIFKKDKRMGSEMKYIKRKNVEELFILALTAALMTLSISYIQQVMTPKNLTEENTTIVRVYGPHTKAGYGAIFLDIEHRLYPETIIVESGQTVELNLTFTISMPVNGEDHIHSIAPVSSTYDFEAGVTAPTMEYFGRTGTELSVEMPRMPSGCRIFSYLTIPGGQTEFYVTVIFYNPHGSEWIVGRPLIKVYGIVAFLTEGLPDDIFYAISVEVTTEINVHTP